MLYFNVLIVFHMLCLFYSFCFCLETPHWYVLLIFILISTQFLILKKIAFHIISWFFKDNCIIGWQKALRPIQSSVYSGTSLALLKRFPSEKYIPCPLCYKFSPLCLMKTLAICNHLWTLGVIRTNAFQRSFSFSSMQRSLIS